MNRRPGDAWAWRMRNPQLEAPGEAFIQLRSMKGVESAAVRKMEISGDVGRWGKGGRGKGGKGAKGEKGCECRKEIDVWVFGNTGVAVLVARGDVFALLLALIVVRSR